jgi:hypothetical protein
VGSEIVIEHHGQVSFTDNADHRFHLGNSSSVSISANTLELRGGDLWFQSLNKNDDYKVKTANALINYQGGEGILSYDSAKGKTQLMVINSIMKLSNLRAPELNLSVSEGHFSFIDNAYDEGAPRDPTPVGEKTYGQLVGLFNGIAPMDKNSAAIFKEHGKTAERAVASVVEKHVENHEVKKVEIDSNLMEEYKKTLFNKSAVVKKTTAKTAKKVVSAPEKTTVHIYGQTRTAVAATTAPAAIKTRAPASVLEQDVPKEVKEPTVVSPYSKDYKNQYKESDKLIDDLKKL